MRRVFACVALCAVAVTVAAGAQAPSADAVAASLQARYASVKDFSAAFIHKYRGGVLRKEAVERGSVQVKKPLLMRWTYESPEKKIFVSDSVRFYSYIPEDRQVIVSPLPDEASAPTPMLFLSGRGNLTRDFTVELVSAEGVGADTYGLKCTPKTPEAEYQSMVLVVDRRSFDIRSLITTDEQGGTSTFVFSNVKQNTGLSDKVFYFEIPKGVDVIHQTAGIR